MYSPPIYLGTIISRSHRLSAVKARITVSAGIGGTLKGISHKFNIGCLDFIAPGKIRDKIQVFNFV